MPNAPKKRRIDSWTWAALATGATGYVFFRLPSALRGVGNGQVVALLETTAFVVVVVVLLLAAFAAAHRRRLAALRTSRPDSVALSCLLTPGFGQFLSGPDAQLERHGRAVENAYAVLRAGADGITIYRGIRRPWPYVKVPRRSIVDVRTEQVRLGARSPWVISIVVSGGGRRIALPLPLFDWEGGPLPRLLKRAEVEGSAARLRRALGVLSGDDAAGDGRLDLMRAGLQAEDLATLQQLVNEGADLRDPRHVVHYSEFGSRRDADEAAAEARDAGWITSVQEPGPGRPDRWGMLAEHAEAVLSVAFVADCTAWFEMLAREHSGEYEGWSADADPAGEPTQV